MARLEFELDYNVTILHANHYAMGIHPASLQKCFSIPWDQTNIVIYNHYLMETVDNII